MRIVCIGGGPAGLYFGLLMKKQNPAHPVTVIERNQPLRHVRLGRRVLRRDDAEHARMGPARRGGDRGRLQSLGRHRGGLQGPAACARPATALSASAARNCSTSCRNAARTLGVELVVRARGRIRTSNFPTPISSSPPTASIRRSATDTRSRSSPIWSVRPNRYIWLGTNKRVRRLHLRFPQDRARLVPGPHLQIRLETPRPSSSRRPRTCSRRMGSTRARPGRTPIAFCEKLFAETLDGAKLMTNARHLRGSAWLNFNRG